MSGTPNILDIPTLVALANRNGKVLGGSVEQIEDLIGAADVAIAVWQDFTRPNGVSLLVIKGQRVVREAVATNTAFEGKVTAIPCREEAQARALLQVCGERDRLN